MGDRERRIGKDLLAWYGENRRDLPWRGSGDPYAIWVSEIMLQQTRVETVLPYFERFMARFPDVRALAEAPLQSVLKAWENLGYYSRARNLHRAAKEIVENHGGTLPADREALLRLSGIGPYTAGAILSFAFGRAEPAVDGNVRRVLSRLYGIREVLERPATQRELDQKARALVPPDRPGDFNQALMDLGSGICTPRVPRCPSCPLAAMCAANRDGDPESLPVRQKRKPVPGRRAAAAVIRDDRGRLLVVKRVDRGLLGGLWKLPGGEVEDGERPPRSLERFVEQELGLQVRAGRDPLAAVEHTYSHFRLTLEAYACEWKAGRPRALGCDAWSWMGPDEQDRFPFSRADRKVMKEIGDRR